LAPPAAGSAVQREPGAGRPATACRPGRW
jgi:hypothetical protein